MATATGTTITDTTITDIDHGRGSGAGNAAESPIAPNASGLCGWHLPEQCSGLPVARYRAEDLAEQFGTGFTTVTTRRELHHAPTGADQPFTWLLARRTRTAAVNVALIAK